MVDMDEERMKVRYKDEEVNFKLFQALQNKEDECTKVKAPNEKGLELKRNNDKESPNNGGKDILTDSYKPP